MPKKSEIPLEPVSVKLFRGDKDELGRFYPAPVGYNIAIRTLVRNHLRKLQEAESRQGDQHVRTHITDAELDELIGDGTSGVG